MGCKTQYYNNNNNNNNNNNIAALLIILPAGPRDNTYIILSSILNHKIRLKLYLEITSYLAETQKFYSTKTKLLLLTRKIIAIDKKPTHIFCEQNVELLCWGRSWGVTGK